MSDISIGGSSSSSYAYAVQQLQQRLFKQLGAMDAGRVARDGYRGLMAGKTVVISGAHNWLVAESVRFAPRKMVTAISRWIAEKVE